MPDGLSIDTHELKELAAAFRDGIVEVEKISGQKLGEIRDEASDYALSIVPVDDGELIGSHEKYGTGGLRGFRFTARHARFVELGTSDTAPQPYANPAAALAGERLLGEFQRLANPLP